ncbi:MAG: hypothetical protein CW345_06400 [Firmicutes bacterium]|nr:hypothetical protein [Bacillota bacterium]MBO2521417.1 hypothetical protein [Bacillota bacterium]
MAVGWWRGRPRAAKLERLRLREEELLRRGLRLAGFVDVETTGLSTTYDEVVEFAIVLFAFDPATGAIAGVVDHYVGLRDPGRPIPPAATAVHGIRDADVRGRRLDLHRIRSLIDRAEFLVAHNARFDRGFVERLLPEVRGKRWHCSMNGVPWKQLGFRSKGLQNLLADHRIRVARAHRGLDDVLGALTLLASGEPGGHCYFKYIVDRDRAQLEAAGQKPSRTRGEAAAGTRRSRPGSRSSKGAAAPGNRLWRALTGLLKALLNPLRRPSRSHRL